MFMGDSCFKNELDGLSRLSTEPTKPGDRNQSSYRVEWAGDSNLDNIVATSEQY